MVTQTSIKSPNKHAIVADSELAVVFKALSDPGRMRIFKLLMEHDDYCVSEIGNAMQQTLPAVSQQLKVLDHAGLLKKIRDGQSICYCLKKEDQLVKDIIKFVQAHE